MKRVYGVLAVAVAFLGAAAFAQSGEGKKFGARDPRTCASRKEPARGHTHGGAS